MDLGFQQLENLVTYYCGALHRCAAILTLFCFSRFLVGIIGKVDKITAMIKNLIGTAAAEAAVTLIPSTVCSGLEV